MDASQWGHEGAERNFVSVFIGAMENIDFKKI